MATYFERQMEKALTANTEAMFMVELGDSHRHALVKGKRQGLEEALSYFKKDYQAEDHG